MIKVENFMLLISCQKRQKERKVILYTPTHRKEGKVAFPLEEHFDFKVLNDWCIQNDIFVRDPAPFFIIKDEKSRFLHVF